MPTSGGHALIIEDEMMIALEVEMHLTQLGFRSFDFALSPDEAIACAKAHRPDLVTADFRIQQGTGAQAVAGIIEAIGAVPVVFVTGNRSLVPEAYAACVVEKPISERRLADACRLACAH